MRNSTPPSASVKRYRDFKKALVDEGITLTEFAKRLDIHRVHLSRSFRDPSVASQRIHDAVDAFIAKHSSQTVAA